MKKFFLLPILISLTACGSRDKPIVVAVDTMCTSIDRYHATDAQIMAAKADEPTWGSWVRWQSATNKVWDAQCLAPSKGN